ncbi:uncharacterized protein BJ212DRAFT_1359926, partial [Suillus subaureus]
MTYDRSALRMVSLGAAMICCAVAVPAIATRDIIAVRSEMNQFKRELRPNVFLLLSQKLFSSIHRYVHILCSVEQTANASLYGPFQVSHQTIM